VRRRAAPAALRRRGRRTDAMWPAGPTADFVRVAAHVSGARLPAAGPCQCAPRWRREAGEANPLRQQLLHARVGQIGRRWSGRGRCVRHGLTHRALWQSPTLRPQSPHAHASGWQSPAAAGQRATSGPTTVPPPLFGSADAAAYRQRYQHQPPRPPHEQPTAGSRSDRMPRAMAPGTSIADLEAALYQARVDLQQAKLQANTTTAHGYAPSPSLRAATPPAISPAAAQRVQRSPVRAAPPSLPQPRHPLPLGPHQQANGSGGGSQRLDFSDAINYADMALNNGACRAPGVDHSKVSPASRGAPVLANAHSRVRSNAPKHHIMRIVSAAV